MGARGRGTRGAWCVASRGRWRRPLVMGLALALIALVAQFSLDGALGVPVARAFTSQAGGVGRAMLAVPSSEETPTDTPTATVTPTEAPTVTPTPSPTPTPLPPTLILVSPSSGTGPVGAHVTLQGSRWGSGTVQVGVASTSTNCPTPGTWLATLGVPSAMGGSFTLTALWPLSLGVPGTTYAVCALGGAGSASVAYQVLAAAPPILSLSAASVQVGLPVTIHGANFYGVTSVTLTLNTTSGSRVLTSLAPFGDGTFGYPYITSLGDAGTVTISAASAAEGSAPPALQASAVLSVLALGTPTATVLTTATAVLGGQGGGAPDGGAPAPLPFWLPLLLGVVALLLAVVALLLIALRRRPGGAPVGGLSQVGMPAVAGRLPAGGPRVAPGTGPLSDGAGDGAAWQEMDAWVPGDEGPGPDWHPRPMGGTRARMPAVEPGEAGWPPDAAPYMSGYQYTPPLAYTAPGLPVDRWSGDQPDELRAGGATTRAAEILPPLPPVGVGVDGQDRDAAATNPEGMTLAEGEGTVDGEVDEMHAVNGAAGMERGAEGSAGMAEAEMPEALDETPGRLSEGAGDGAVAE